MRINLGSLVSVVIPPRGDLGPTPRADLLNPDAFEAVSSFSTKDQSKSNGKKTKRSSYFIPYSMMSVSFRARERRRRQQPGTGCSIPIRSEWTSLPLDATKTALNLAA